MNFYIFRHGETFETKNNLDYTKASVLSSPILPEGFPAIEKLAKYLSKIETDANYSSPFLRCKQTVEIVEKISEKKFSTKGGPAFGWRVDDRLGEFLEIKGEAFENFAKRVKNFLDEVRSKNFESVAICTHGAVIAGLKHFLLERGFEEHQLYDFPRPGVLLEIKDNVVKTIDFGNYQ